MLFVISRKLFDHPKPNGKKNLNDRFQDEGCYLLSEQGYFLSEVK